MNWLMNFSALYIKNGFVRVLSFHFIADGLGKVCFAKSHAAIDDERIERGAARFVGHRFAGPPGHTVAVSFNKGFEGVVVVQLGIYLYTFDTRDHKRVFHRILYR